MTREEARSIEVRFYILCAQLNKKYLATQKIIGLLEHLSEVAGARSTVVIEAYYKYSDSLQYIPRQAEIIWYCSQHSTVKIIKKLLGLNYNKYYDILNTFQKDMPPIRLNMAEEKILELNKILEIIKLFKELPI